MPEKKTCEIYLAINEDGDYEVGDIDETAVDRLGENYGGYARRFVKIVVKITPPTIAEAEVDVPDDAGETVKIEAEAE